MPNPSSRPPRRGEDPRPYPGAPSRTRPHRARPGTSRSTGSRSTRAQATAAIPCSVWAPDSPVDPDLLWPPAVVRQITTAFSDHGARVGLLSWPTTDTAAPDQEDPALDEQADAGLAMIDKLGRAGVVEHLPAPPTETTRAAAGSAPFETPQPPGLPAAATPEFPTGAAGDLDLVITSLTPGESFRAVSDLVARHAARRLQAGGILAVLTHSEQRGGELIDPTGTVVAAGQDADLLYLQHLVVLHTPLHRDPVTPAERLDPGPGPIQAHGRAHSDLLVFAQPTGPADAR